MELFLRGRLGPKVTWLANYAYAATEDELDEETGTLLKDPELWPGILPAFGVSVRF